ncbi:MAG: hypothetical protein U0167_01875 [bacterium]
MKVVFLVFLAILALNALVILGITGILLLDHFRSRRRRATAEAPADDAHPNPS